MNKKIFLLLLIVLSLMSMSAISASDVNDNNQTLALDSSSDISAVSTADADVLAVNNNDEIQPISYDDKDPIMIYFSEGMYDHPARYEHEEITIEFEILDASGDEPCPFIGFYDDLEVELVIDDKVVQTTETENLKGKFTIEEGLGPGLWEIELRTNGNDDFGPCGSGMRMVVLPMIGSRIILDEFDPDWTEDGEITLEYNETMDVDFKAITDISKSGLKNVEFR